MPRGRDLEPTLTRSTRPNPWRSLGLRLLLVTGLLVAVFALLWFDRDGLLDQVDNNLSFVDVLYFTMITITTVGYGDIVPVSDKARLIDAFLITPVRLFIWLIFLGTAVDMLFKQSFVRWRMRKIQDRLSDHVIVAGYGHSGRTAAHNLVAKGIAPGQLLVIDCDESACDHARQAGFSVIEGDATSNHVLASAHLDRATSLMACSGRDDTSILIVLTARSLAPALPIAVVVRAADNEQLARNAGATQVINPIAVIGQLLAETAVAPKPAGPVA